MRTLSLLLSIWLGASVGAKPPNVVLVITDDQGYGDLGCHGNPVLKTPHIDAFAQQSLEMTHFHVSPVCAPTRASLLTGRYNYRTGVVDTFAGRAMMRPGEVTLAELFAAAGYRTGLFGKWHLGDNYPLRPQDRGFQEVLMHHGGGIGQPSDPPGSSYFKPVLERNGTLKPFDRYCTDAFTDAAQEFIAAHRDRPFFAHVAFNCPHAPLQVRDEDLAAYKSLDLSAALTRPGQQEKNRALNATLLAKLYGMVANVDANVGRLLAKLDELQLARDTIVIFMTDNGPQEARYNAGLRGLKGSTFDGGIRVPFFVRWPGRIDAGRQLDAPAAHIDILPTLCSACGLKRPEDRVIDGTDLLPYWTGATRELPIRDLFFQWHRGDAPELGRAYAVRGPRFKLVQAVGASAKPTADNKPMLFAVAVDPLEKTDLAAAQPKVVAEMVAKYEAWFRDVTSAGFAPVRVRVGSPKVPVTRLTRQDWRGPTAADWTAGGIGHWELTLERGGRYDVRVALKPTTAAGTLRLRFGGATLEAALPKGAEAHTFAGVQIADGVSETTLDARFEAEGKSVGAWTVEVERR